MVLSHPRTWTMARWTLAAAALVVVLSFPIFTGTAFLSFGPVPYFLAVIVGLAIAATATGNRWVMLATGIVMLAFTGLNAPFLLPELARPDHYPEFPVALAVVLGGPIGLVASIVAVVQGRASVTAPRAQWGSPGGVLALLAFGLVVGGAFASVQLLNAPDLAAGAILLTPDAVVSAVTEADEFVPATISIPSGQIVKLAVANRDAGLHVFNVDELNVDAELPAGKTTDIWLEVDTPGTYQLYCELHVGKGADGRWEGMVGIFTVV